MAEHRDIEIDKTSGDSVKEQLANDDVAALREALSEMAAGDEGIPFEEFDGLFRARHMLPDR
jgi:hypothetical protein